MALQRFLTTATYVRTGRDLTEVHLVSCASRRHPVVKTSGKIGRGTFRCGGAEENGSDSLLGEQSVSRPRLECGKETETAGCSVQPPKKKEICAQSKI